MQNFFPAAAENPKQPIRPLFFRLTSCSAGSSI